VDSLRNSRWLKRLWLPLLLTAVAVVVFGVCQRRRTSEPPEAVQAVAVARAEAERRGWKRLYVREVTFQNDVWTVELERRPIMYGAHATVKIARDGRVLSFKPGL